MACIITPAPEAAVSLLPHGQRVADGASAHTGPRREVCDTAVTPASGAEAHAPPAVMTKVHHQGCKNAGTIFRGVSELARWVVQMKLFTFVDQVSG